MGRPYDGDQGALEDSPEPSGAFGSGPVPLVRR